MSAEKEREYRKRYYAANPDKYREANRRYYAAHPEKHLEAVRRWSAANLEKCRENRRRWCAGFKKTVFDYYGCKCQWSSGCDVTDPDMLQIDHINGDGYKHRKEIGGGGIRMYQWLIRNNFPPGFRLLCANHNWKYRANMVRAKEAARLPLLPIQATE